jgi:glycine oxidase
MSTSTHSVDVVIAGGGIIGCSIAYRLAQRGLQVAVCDAGTLGGRASSASAGMLAPGGEVNRLSEWASRMVASLGMYPDYVAELCEASGESIDYRESGALELAYTDGQWGTLERRAETQRLVGVRAEPVDPADLPRKVLGDSVRWAMRYPDDAVVNPRHIMNALRKALVSRGATIIEGAAVVALEVKDDSLKIQLPDRTLHGRTGVLAAGAWSSRVVVRLRKDLSTVPQTFPVKGHLTGYHLPPDSLPWIVRHDRTYVLQRSGGYTIAGSNEERAGFDETVRPAAIREIHSSAEKLLPGLLKNAASAESWVGFRPATEGGPEVRRWKNSALWLAYGHYRNGILLAPWTAGAVAGEIMSTLEKD